MYHYDVSSPLPAAFDVPPPAGTAPDAAKRTYFRCHPLAATISVAQCRANRAKVSWSAAVNSMEVMPMVVQPAACGDCPLAPRVEAGAVPFYTAAEVLAGLPGREAPVGPGYGEGDPPEPTARPGKPTA